MIELLGAFSLTILGFIVCIVSILYMRKNQKKEPLPFIKYYAMQAALILISILALAVFWDALTVMPKMLKEENKTVKGACTVDYWESTKGSSLDIQFSEDVFFNVPSKNWDKGSLKMAYCEVTYYESSEFGVQYKIYDKQEGTLLQGNE